MVRPTLLLGVASYLDAGSIVAGGAGLALWAQHFDLGTGTIGLIGAISSNAISAGVGALAGGWLADRYGRKWIYQWDLLLYAFGLLWIIFAVSPWMLIGGYALIGLAVGADIPASWTLILEHAPDGARGRHAGVAQLLWALGPLTVLVMAFVLSGLGLLGIRIVFAHLLVIALVLFFLRRPLRESRLWERATRVERPRLHDVSALFGRRLLIPLLLLMGTYGLWNLQAGTNGFFLPYLLRTVGAQTQAQSLALQAAQFVLGMLSGYFIFMRLADRASHLWLFLFGIGLQIVALVLLALFPLGTLVAVGYVGLVGLGGGAGPQAFFMLWSAEAFPTRLRGTALGLMFGIVRLGLGLWSLVVPALSRSSVSTLAWILLAFLLASAVLGAVYARSPRTARLRIAAER